MQIMDILRTLILLLLVHISAIFCFPSRPLNERSTELAWQAWLLVDDQNQNKQNDTDGVLRRRITPKSVFIAPTFSPESLPACADGYRSDSMGNCIQIIKLDEAAHLDFLLQKLNNKFGNFGGHIGEDEEDLPTPGPFQVNIPFGGNLFGSDLDSSEGMPDIAIVVAPTNGNFDGNGLKINVKRTDNKENNETKVPNGHDEPNTTDMSVEIDGSVQTTTAETEGTTTTILPTTTMNLNEETTEAITQTESTETTTFVVDTTIDDRHALFFLDPLSQTEHVQNGTNNAKDTPSLGVSDINAVTARTQTKDGLTTSTAISETTFRVNESEDNATPRESIIQAQNVQIEDVTSTTEKSSANLVRFPVDETAQHNDRILFPGDLTDSHVLPHTNYAQQFHYSQQKPESDASITSSSQFRDAFDKYIRTREADLKQNERLALQNREPIGEASFQSTFKLDPETSSHQTHSNHDRLQSNTEYGSASEQTFNHRNRDKNSNSWSLPPNWRESSPQKPLVLKFLRRSANNRHVNTEQFITYPHNPKTLYREVPPEELSYIFGSNRRRRSRR